MRTPQELLERAERNSLLSLTLHNLLVKADMADEARLAWLLYLDEAAQAEALAEGLGVEANVA